MICRIKFKDEEEFKNYQDRLKSFLKVSLKYIPFLKNLNGEIIEEITYHLKQKYYDPNEVIFRDGKTKTKLLFRLPI